MSVSIIGFLTFKLFILHSELTDCNSLIHFMKPLFFILKKPDIAFQRAPVGVTLTMLEVHYDEILLILHRVMKGMSTRTHIL